MRDAKPFRWQIAVVIISVALGRAAAAQAPLPTDPEGMAMGGLPGNFPTTVTAANIDVQQFTPAQLNGINQNNYRVTFPASGPLKWTESRHNEGDISPLVGPFDPNDPDYYPPTTFVDNYGPITNGPFEKSTLAWRLSNVTGAALATVRHNGVDYGNNYTANGQPVGTIHGIAYMNQSGSGWGFRMSDGVFANGGNGSLDLQMGVAGFNGSDQGEANFSTAVAYFPYAQGWVGAWVNGADDGEATFGAASMGLPTSTVNWTSSQAFVQLPDVNSASDGMLFVAPTHDDNNTNIAAAFPNAGGWTVSVREDDSATFAGDQASILSGGQNGFQFLYVPYSAPRLIGGHINGADASLIHSAGDASFDVSRTKAGEYAVSVFGADGQTKLTENDGMLILSVASSMPGEPMFADRTFLSYDFDQTSSDFIIQSREVSAIGQPMPPSENQFGDVLALRDSNFYFAWVSFTNPLQPVATGIPGDYNDNGAVDAADYVLWRHNLNASVTLPNDSTPGSVTADDYGVWKANFGQTAALGSGLVSHNVPEPASALLMAVLLGPISVSAVRVRRRR